MKKVKWLYYELPISIGKLSKLILSNQYSEDAGCGFLLSKSNSRAVEARYIEKGVSVSIIQDPFGNEIEASTVAYYICSFRLNRDSNLLCINNPPRTLKKFISKMHDLVGLGFVLSDLVVDPLQWALSIEKDVKSLSITNISSYGIKVEKSGLAKISVSGKKDIREEFGLMTDSIDYKTDSVKCNFELSDSFVSISLSKAGNAQIQGGNITDLINVLHGHLENQLDSFVR